jgi:hypothetical protein
LEFADIDLDRTGGEGGAGVGYSGLGQKAFVVYPPGIERSAGVGVEEEVGVGTDLEDCPVVEEEGGGGVRACNDGGVVLEEYSFSECDGEAGDDGLDAGAGGRVDADVAGFLRGGGEVKEEGWFAQIMSRSRQKVARGRTGGVLGRWSRVDWKRRISPGLAMRERRSAVSRQSPSAR